MKHWGTHKTIWVAWASVAVVLVAAVGWLLIMPPIYNCGTDRSTDPRKIHATKVVVQPWLGLHHVFGIFVVPLLFRSGRIYSGRITVQSFTEEFAPDWHQIQSLEDVIVEPGYYLVRGYVPTRIALWFLVTGQFDELRSPCNWTLEFSERSQ